MVVTLDRSLELTARLLVLFKNKILNAASPTRPGRRAQRRLRHPRLLQSPPPPRPDAERHLRAAAAGAGEAAGPAAGRRLWRRRRRRHPGRHPALEARPRHRPRAARLEACPFDPGRVPPQAAGSAAGEVPCKPGEWGAVEPGGRRAGRARGRGLGRGERRRGAAPRDWERRSDGGGSGCSCSATGPFSSRACRSWGRGRGCCGVSREAEDQAEGQVWRRREEELRALLHALFFWLMQGIELHHTVNKNLDRRNDVEGEKWERALRSVVEKQKRFFFSVRWLCRQR